MHHQIGPIYKLHRKQRKIILEDICKLVGLSTTKLSDFENGKVQLEESQIKELYHCIHMEYKNDEKDIQNFQELFHAFYKCILMYEDYESSYKHLMQYKQFVCTNTYYIQYVLAKFIYGVYKNKAVFEFKEQIELIQTNFDYLDDDKKQIYYDTVGVYHKNIYQYDKALYYFDKASIFGNDSITAMMYYHKTMIFSKQGNLTEALESIKDAKLCFDKHVNMKRSLLCNGMIAQLYVRLGAYNKGIEAYKQCIDYMKQLSFTRDLIVVHNNLTWAYVLKQDFEQAITVSNQTLELCHNHAPSYFFQAYSYHYLKQDEYAIQAIKKAKECLKTFECTRYMKAMIQVYSFILSDKKSSMDKIKKLEVALREAEKCHDFQIELFVMKLLIEQYKVLSDEKSIIFYQNKMIEIYEKRK